MPSIQYSINEFIQLKCVKWAFLFAKITKQKINQEIINWKAKWPFGIEFS